jgi:hypothetical protein
VDRFIVVLRLLLLIIILILLGESRMARRERCYLSLVETMQRLEKWPAVC